MPIASHARNAIAATLLFVTGIASAQGVSNTSYVLASGERVLQHQTVVPASLAEVWQAFTTSEGLHGFLAPVAHIDFRPGGLWESSYDPAAKLGDPRNIRNEIVAFVPMRLIVVRIIGTPPDFPHAEVAKQVWTVFEFDDLGFGRVRVTGSMAGWKTGADWDAVYRFFERGNAQVLALLVQRFTTGPVKWKSPAAEGAAQPAGEKSR